MKKRNVGVMTQAFLFFVMCCKEMPVTLFLACAGFEMTDVVHKIQKEI